MAGQRYRDERRSAREATFSVAFSASASAVEYSASSALAASLDLNSSTGQ
jgi:hypothetical protein